MLSHIIFLGIFYAVLLVIICTLTVSLFRAAEHFRARREEAICWQATFPDLPARERACRHEFTGEFKQRTCDKAFDCRVCRTHAALLAKQPPDATLAAKESVLWGLPFPLDRFYHRGHTWAHPEPDGTVTIGLDPLGAALATQPESIDLPTVGSRIQVNGAAWHVRKRGVDVRILSPADGEIVDVGGPDTDWYLKVKPDNGKLDVRHLLRGAEIRPWITREMERLQAALAHDNQTPTMADGGTLVGDIAAAFPGSDWESICGQIFLLP
jgi:glycine cleavage system H lipoate-binding protein